MQWDDLRVFLALATGGSLRRAARTLRVGQPTVVRRIRQLERAVGTPLFERRPDGHRLTVSGQELLPMAQGMADAAAAIDRRQPFTDPSAGSVRVAAGEWSARFLAPRLGALAEAHADLVVELLETNVPPDLGRREADVFIRHGLPARGHLVTVRLGVMAAAIYGSAPLVAAQPAARTEARWQACPWVAYDTPHEYFGSMAWLAGRLAGRRPRVRASQFALQLEAIRAGSGLGILPCFIGDADPGLVRVSAPIEDLAHEFWLLVRPDLKTAPRVRAVIEWTRSIFRQDRAALEGRGARRT